MGDVTDADVDETAAEVDVEAEVAAICGEEGEAGEDGEKTACGGVVIDDEAAADEEDAAAEDEGTLSAVGVCGVNGVRGVEGEADEGAAGLLCEVDVAGDEIEVLAAADVLGAAFSSPKKNSSRASTSGQHALHNEVQKNVGPGRGRGRDISIPALEDGTAGNTLGLTRRSCS